MGKNALYTPEFKLSAVKEVTSHGKRPSHVAREYRVLPSTLFSWRTKYKQFGESVFVTQNMKQEVLELVEAENKTLRRHLETIREKEVALERLLGQMMLENHQMREQHKQNVSK